MAVVGLLPGCAAIPTGLAGLQLLTRPQVEAFAVEEFDRQVKFARGVFRLEDYNPYLIMSWGEDSTSYGGIDIHDVPQVDIGLSQLVGYRTDPEGVYDEYEEFQSEPGIHSIWCGWRTFVACLLAHEIAHTLEIHTPSRKRVSELLGVKTDRRHHGVLWKALYKIMRDDVRRQGIETTERWNPEEEMY